MSNGVGDFGINEIDKENNNQQLTKYAHEFIGILKTSWGKWIDVLYSFCLLN